MSGNRFDLIRLVLATAVFAFHAVALTALDPSGPLESGLAVAAELSIQGFFIVSGALVAGSLARSKTVANYTGKRVRRLYPAYATVILIPAAVSLALTGNAAGVARYVGANLVFLNFLSPDLPGLFADNRFTAVNGALWTLKVEVMFYIALPVIAVLMRAFGRAGWVVLALLYAGGEAWRHLVPVLLQNSQAPDLARQLPGQLAFFASGIALWGLWHVAKARPMLFGAVGLLLLAASFAHPFAAPLRAAGLAGTIAAIAFLPGPVLNAARFGDVSYGVYITHFPILQAMIMAGLFVQLGFAAGFAIAALFVFAASFLLWHLVEKPALRPSSHYRQVAS
ncbi:acyltransferase family protein [Hyphomonas adhaerens MHS-3]|uniref:Acyltransferase family protein n=1 Tax=Hyphomonas adhaerens MHS-3 TaxID=1280949 RepID=A0A069E8I5_9PROT|nr:acyltransferase [Hyphomonas adhaerens]KCZ84226.1 acyltransferase family protein [Hyphomonas adhaerens MHS-3]